MSQSNQEVGEITEILSRWNQAKEESLDEVFPKVYENLRQLAKRARRRIGRTDPDDTLCTLELVNEMYIKLRESESLDFKNRGRFYAFCILAMQRTLRDYYMRKNSKKKELRLEPEIEKNFEDTINFSLIKISDSSLYSPELVILCEEILTKLAEKHPRKVEVIFLKYWLEETDKEIAEHLNISEKTVRRDFGLGEVLIKYEIDNKMKPILNEAADITDTTLRDEYLRNACGENNSLLKHIETLLKENLKKQIG
jgi:RNA polymerase sigma factor (TIGR02999 family)